MKRVKLWATLLLLTLTITTTLSGCSNSGSVDIDKEITHAAQYVYDNTPDPGSGSVGGDWAVKGLAESGFDVEDGYFDRYYDSVRAAVKSKDGVLSEEKYTEYERTVIGVMSIGKEPTDIEGYNIFAPIDDYEKVTDQGVNAADFALIASNTAGIKLKNEQKYIDYIIESLEKNNSFERELSIDYTAMAVQALSFYKDDEKVKKVIDKCVGAMSDIQKADGDYGNCESTVEVIIAVTAVGIDPENDERFVKDGKNLADGLLKYKTDKGYRHVDDDSISVSKAMPTEKALLALCAMKLYEEDKTLYGETV